MSKRKLILPLLVVVAIGGPALAASSTYWADSGGVYDENTYNTNAVDGEVVAGSLAAFKTSMAAAWAADLGGVVDFSYNGAVYEGKYGTEGSELLAPFTITYGISQTKTIVATLPSNKYPGGGGSVATDAAQMYSARDGNTGIDAISSRTTSDYHYIDSLIYSNRYAVAAILGEIYWEFPEGAVGELGITALAAQATDWLAPAATRGGADYTQEVTVTFSGGSSQTLTSVMSNAAGNGLDDTFFHFAAPAGQSIVRMDALDPSHGGMTAYDDLAFLMVGFGIPEPGTLSLLTLGGLGVLIRRKRK